MPIEEAKPAPKRRPRGSRSTPRKTTVTAAEAKKLEKEVYELPSVDIVDGPAPEGLEIQPEAPKTRVEAPAPDDEGTGLKVIAERLAQAQQEDISSKVVMEEITPDGSVSEMELGEAPRQTAPADKPPVKYSIRPKKKKTKEEEEVEEVDDGEGKIPLGLPEPDKSPIKVQQLTLGEQVKLDDNTAAYGTARVAKVAREEVVAPELKNTQEDRDMKNYASLMKMVGEMSTEIDGLAEKVSTISNELADKIRKICDLEDDLKKAYEAIEKVYIPATEIVLKKRRYRKKLNAGLLDSVLAKMPKKDEDTPKGYDING